MKTKTLILTGTVLFAAIVIGSKTADAKDIFQLYNVQSMEHLYTGDAHENNQLPIISPNWLKEGVAWVAPDSGSPVYSVYNPNSGEHLYTTSKYESDSLVRSGWRGEGVKFYSGGNIPIYRLYNPAAGIGSHHFTQNSYERDSLMKSGWKYEGVAMYATGGGRPIANNHKIVDGRHYYDNMLIANKKHSLPSNYNPGDNKEAVTSLRRLQQDMHNQGMNVSNSYSGFRTSAYQAKLYNAYVAKDGKAAADKYSARPGYSEHQTGLAFDLINNSGQLIESKREADWIANNAWKYGFIVRYPKGKEASTGYQYEPWHLRYVGSSSKAKSIKDSGKTLEQYVNAPGGNYN